MSSDTVHSKVSTDADEVAIAVTDIVRAIEQENEVTPEQVRDAHNKYIALPENEQKYVRHTCYLTTGRFGKGFFKLPIMRTGVLTESDIVTIRRLK